ncbi:MAG: WbqC family protein [Muribaculaceae bacterium]|nr:WbqC family protein [Muribaculaceae bacterium]
MTVLSTACFGTVDRFRLLAREQAGGRAVAVADGARFDKRYKDSHRFTIADTRGPLTLTIPICAPDRFPCRWADIIVSDHGRWTETLPTALESAYGRTPYFEFYIDSLLPLIKGAPGRPLTEFNQLTESLLCQWFALEPPVYDADCRADGLRPISAADSEPYWQVRAASLGFIPGLSALDLLFNLGPEAALFLQPLKSTINQ